MGAAELERLARRRRIYPPGRDLDPAAEYAYGRTLDRAAASWLALRTPKVAARERAQHARELDRQLATLEAPGILSHLERDRVLLRALGESPASVARLTRTTGTGRAAQPAYHLLRDEDPDRDPGRVRPRHRDASPVRGVAYWSEARPAAPAQVRKAQTSARVALDEGAPPPPRGHTRRMA